MPSVLKSCMSIFNEFFSNSNTLAAEFGDDGKMIVSYLNVCCRYFFSQNRQLTLWFFLSLKVSPSDRSSPKTYHWYECHFQSFITSIEGRATEREGQRGQFAPGPQAPRGLRLQGASSTNIKIFVIASLDVFKEHPNRSSL